MALETRFGVPARIQQSDSLDSVLIIEPTLGLDYGHASVNAPLGATPYCENFIIRDGGLEPRPMLSLRATNQQPITTVLGGAEILDVAANRYPFVTGTTRPAWFSNTSWSAISYVRLGGAAPFDSNFQPAGGTGNYWDVTQIYDANSNENCAIFANGSQQTLYCWQANNQVAGQTPAYQGYRFSTLSAAPQARYVTAFNDYLVAFNLAGGLVQRVQWNDRGSISSWTGGLSGFADLLDMRGQGTRIVTQENRMVLFSEAEVWGGFPAAFPYIFDFQPLDRNVGCPYSWTIANTPAGLMFLSNDYNVYVLPRYGGPPRPVGGSVQRYIRDNIDQPSRAWAVYDHTYNVYQLYLPVKSGSGYPQRSLWLKIDKIAPTPFAPVGADAWALQSFDKVANNLSLQRGFEAQLSSSATTWGGLTAVSVVWNDLALTWAQLGGASEARAIHPGSSNGTMYYFNSNATSDNGTAVRSIWRSSALFGFQPNRQKTMGRIRVDYQADSQSTISFEASRTQGASFEPSVQLSLPPNSYLSEAIAHVYAAARYPMFQVSSEAERYRLYRFWLSVRAGGR